MRNFRALHLSFLDGVRMVQSYDLQGITVIVADFKDNLEIRTHRVNTLLSAQRHGCLVATKDLDVLKSLTATLKITICELNLEIPELPAYTVVSLH